MPMLVFLRLCHLLAASEMIMGMKPLRLVDYIHIVQPYKNSVNMMRANLMFVKIDGEDPKSHRPDWLYVVAKGNNPLPPAEELAHKFGELESVDVQVIDKNTAVLAVSTFYGSKHILKAFRHDKTMSVTRYSWLQHCKPVRYGLWCSIIMMGAFCVWTFIGDK
ncbi:uncharacterized protein LOC117105264 [Anneissia japonica]|uniref:uncharacterized protein LOC117105264 n=1 Tax=Anneissia japonica TaxID=1529436 RepID=UPI001425B94F|nr:uncharacterized protein LOC117105264 [Anneissia japonica]